MALKRHPSSKAKKTKKTPRRAKYWSGRVTRESDALDLDRRIFTWHDPARIAASLKRSAERSNWRKTEPYRSAMSMLTFYLNRGGRNLPSSRRRILEHAKRELRRKFGKDTDR
ncbi:MAG TPA: DUF3175 domain-containing protein [Stellaceae bacterium]|jgi:hypothetical protein